MAESSLQEKAKEAVEMERRAITAKKDKDTANRKVGVLEGKVEESNTNLD